jgi:hypothetical protein
MFYSPFLKGIVFYFAEYEVAETKLVDVFSSEVESNSFLYMSFDMSVVITCLRSLRTLKQFGIWGFVSFLALLRFLKLW